MEEHKNAVDADLHRARNGAIDAMIVFNIPAKILMLLIALAFLDGCGNGARETEKVESTKQASEIHAVTPERISVEVSENADFEGDFTKSIERGDLRFVGIMGYALVVPGVKDYGEKYSKTNGVKIIEGTSDSYPDSASLRRAVFWDAYASRYNALLLSYLSRNMKTK